MTTSYPILITNGGGGWWSGGGGGYLVGRRHQEIPQNFFNRYHNHSETNTLGYNDNYEEPVVLILCHSPNLVERVS